MGSGLIPLVNEIRNYLFPQKPFHPITNDIKKNRISIDTIILVIAFITALLGLVKELLSFFNKS